MFHPCHKNNNNINKKNNPHQNLTKGIVQKVSRPNLKTMDYIPCNKNKNDKDKKKSLHKILHFECIKNLKINPIGPGVLDPGKK